MPKTVGYISQNLDNSIPVPSVPVTQKLVGTNAPTSVSASTDTNGRYTLTNDDYPGLVYTDAVPPGSSQVIRRRGDTVGQIGEIWSGDLVGFLDMFTEGVHPTVSNALQVGPGTGLQVTMQPGSAIVRGHPFIVTGSKSFTVAANALAATRRDRVVIQLTRTGDLAGKMDRLLVQGASDGSLAALTQNGTTWQLPIATINVVQNASAFSSSDITDDRTRFTIPSSVGAATVGTTQLIDGAVTQGKIAPNSVDGSKIMDGSVALAELAANSVDASKIVDLAVGTAELAALSVTTPKIALLAVNTGQIADLAVTGPKIAAGTIPESKLDAAALAKLNAAGSAVPPANSITSAMIVNGTIVAADLAAGTITSNEIATGTIIETDLATAVQTKLNAAGYTGGGSIIRMTPLSRDGASGRTGAVTSTTGISIASGSITIPNDGKTYDLIATGSIGTFNGTNVATSVAVQINGNLSAWQGGAGATYRDIGLTHGFPGLTSGTYTVAIFMKVAGGSGEYDHYLLDVYAVPR